ncbi:MAG: response regulator receiver modulated diguanylate phosphodiesterase [Frankiales bacterium]|nr:response regulator receiver modulated diguanylate phosphodiesterase [Frankiales bacterium]
MAAAPPPRSHARGRWALPARPPEEWLGPGWSVLLTLLLGVAAVVPLTALLRTVPRTPASATAALLGAGVAAACGVAAWSLLVQGSVTGDRRLGWVGAGFLLLHPAVLALAVAEIGPGSDRPVALLLLAALPVLVLTSPVAARLRAPARALAVLVPVGLVAVAAVVAVRRPSGADRPLGLVLALLALAVWVRSTPRRAPWGWVTVALVLSVAGLSVGVVDRTLSPGWTAAVVGTPLLVPALGLALKTSSGYARQLARWRSLEQEVRASRIPSALLPGRSVLPEDDEGLPEPQEVRDVLADGTVLVALQPVLRLSDGQVVGHEALARFGGRIPTDRWFRGASRCGLGLDLEVLCLARALALLPTLPDPQFLAVNVSPAALLDARTQGHLDGADLSRVVVEVTEHEAVADYPRVQAVLDRLRERGARIAVDDTGAGYASLRHVLLLQPEVVKLDTLLVRDLATDPRKRSLVVALVRFAQEVGTTVLAEGIETREQLEALLGIDVELGQGWHLGVPVVPGERVR